MWHFVTLCILWPLMAFLFPESLNTLFPALQIPLNRHTFSASLLIVGLIGRVIL